MWRNVVKGKMEKIIQNVADLECATEKNELDSRLMSQSVAPETSVLGLYGYLLKIQTCMLYPFLLNQNL